MVSKNIIIIPCILALFLSLAKCDIEQDKQRCANQLIGAATCLPYVSGEANFPPMDCCTGFRQVLQNSPECVCLLVKDRDDPSLGIQINATRALGLPDRCHITANRTLADCPALLHLPPNSPDAKVFQDFANIANKNNTTTPAANTTTTPTAGTTSSGGTRTTTSANQMSDGGKRKRWSSTELVAAIFSLAMFAL